MFFLMFHCTNFNKRNFPFHTFSAIDFLLICRLNRFKSTQDEGWLLSAQLYVCLFQGRAGKPRSDPRHCSENSGQEKTKSQLQWVPASNGWRRCGRYVTYCVMYRKRRRGSKIILLWHFMYWFICKLDDCHHSCLLFSQCNICVVIQQGELFLHKSVALPLTKCSSSLSVIEFLVPCTVIDGSNEFTHAHAHFGWILNLPPALPDLYLNPAFT